MDLNESDFKLLSYLYHHQREPVTKIAKAVKLSRGQVDYKLNKYIKEGLIRKFVSVFNYSKLGYNYYAILLLRFEKPPYKNKFIEGLAKNKNCISWGNVFGKYELYVNCIFKDETEFSKFIGNLISNSQYPLLDSLVIKPFFAEMYPLKLFRHKDRENFLIIDNTNKKIKLDDKDMKILKALNEDGRIRLIDIASKSRISSESALYKLKKLYKEKVVLGSRMQFDMEKLGYSYSIISLNIKNFSEKNKEKIKRFVRQSEFTNSLIFSLMKPNCIIQLFYKEEAELRKVIDQIRKLFSDESVDIDILMLDQEEKEVNSLPFI